MVCIRSRSLCVVQTGGVGARLGFLRGNYCQRGGRVGVGLCSQTYRTNERGGQNKQTNNDKKKKTPAVATQTIQSLRGTFHRTRQGITRNGLCDISFSSSFFRLRSDARASRFLTRRFGKPCAEPAAGIRSAACAKCFSAG